MSRGEALDRDAALAQVARLRQRGRSRPAALRALTAAAGGVLALASVPLVAVLPEIGVPALLLALRLLAVEFDWAARTYAWVVWKWELAKAWYRGRSATTRALIVIALLALAVVLLWLLAEELL